MTIVMIPVNVPRELDDLRRKVKSKGYIKFNRIDEVKVGYNVLLIIMDINRQKKTIAGRHLEYN